MWPPKQAPQVGVETHRAGLDEHVEQALAQRLAVDPLRRRDDDRAAVAGGRVRPRRISAAWRRSVIVPFAQLPMYTWSICVPTASATGTTLPGKCGSAISGSSCDEVDPQRPARTPRRGPTRSAVHGRSVRPSR